MFHLAKPVGETYTHFARLLGATTSPTLMDRAFRAAWREQSDRPPIPGPRENDDRKWWKNLASNTLHKATQLPHHFPEDLWFENVYQHYVTAAAWVLYDDVIPTLERLSGRHRLAVISNFDGRLRSILHGHGLSHYFEHIFISSEVGADKPHPEIFEHALRTMGVPATACWHVGDDPVRDWAGARAAGLTSFELNRPETTLHDLPA